MFEKRTDLALERLEDLSGQPLPGVESRQWRQSPLSIHRITVTDSRGEQAIGRPRGQYLTAQMEPEALSDSQWIFRSATVLAQLLRPMLPTKGTVLVAGLGNRALTPDALGPMTLEHLMVTRHLIEVMPGEFGHLRPVCALAAGVLGSTGIETAEILRGAAQRVEPSAIVAVDAMASRSLDRLCRTFQLSDTGIAPGSGAAEAGLQSGDVITHINGTLVENLSSAAKLRDKYSAGDTISVTIFRRGAVVITELKLSNRQMIISDYNL